MRWQEARAAPDGREVTVYYMGCPDYTLERVETTESESDVTITLYESIPEGMHRVMLSVRSHEVELGRELGSRTVIDGARDRDDAYWWGPLPPGFGTGSAAPSW